MSCRKYGKYNVQGSFSIWLQKEAFIPTHMFSKMNHWTFLGHNRRYFTPVQPNKVHKQI